MRLKSITHVIGGLLCASAISATEVRVVRFQVTFPDFSPPPCPTLVGWASQTFFQNTTDTTQTVSFLGVSNGDARSNPRPLTIPPRQAISLSGESQLDWEPAQNALLWVNRLDIPDGVLLANRVQSFVSQPNHPETPCAWRNTTYAGLPLPVFSSLIPAGKTQYFLGTDVGSDPSNIGITDSRLNVGVYNGGNATATAVVKIYCGAPGSDPGFPNSLLATASIQLPANAVIQQTVLASSQAAGCFTAGNSFWYSTVAVDQPSFAYAIGLSNEAPPKFPGTVAVSYSP